MNKLMICSLVVALVLGYSLYLGQTIDLNAQSGGCKASFCYEQTQYNPGCNEEHYASTCQGCWEANGGEARPEICDNCAGLTGSGIPHPSRCVGCVVIDSFCRDAIAPCIYTHQCVYESYSGCVNHPWKLYCTSYISYCGGPRLIQGQDGSTIIYYP